MATPGHFGSLTRLTGLHIHFEVTTGFFQEIFSLPRLALLKLNCGADVPAEAIIKSTSLARLALKGQTNQVRSQSCVLQKAQI